MTEYKLLHYLLSNARRVLTREQILAHVWDYTFTGNASVLETYISYLRHKIDAVEPPLIHTVRGVGYTLRHPARKGLKSPSWEGPVGFAANRWA